MNTAIFTKIIQVDVPDCADPTYNIQPLIVGWSTFSGIILVICVTILVGMWIDKK